MKEKKLVKIEEFKVIEKNSRDLEMKLKEIQENVREKDERIEGLSGKLEKTEENLGKLKQENIEIAEELKGV